MTVKDYHPESTLSGQITQLLYGSLILSTAVTAVSLVNLGRLSVFMAPIAFFLTIIHHSILLRLTRRARMNATETKIALAPTSYKANIIASCILIFLWVVVVLAVVIISVMVVTNAYETWERLAGYLEIPFEVAEICVLIVLTFKCRKQRQRTLGELSVDRRDYSSTTVA